MTRHEEFLRDLDTLQTDLSNASRALRAAAYNSGQIELSGSDKKYMMQLADSAQGISSHLDIMRMG